MKLREIILQNFRGYYNETRIPVDDLTALIGQNDVGKSTILEALDIFFNQSKIESGDKNILHTDEETVIGCVFDELPETIVLEDVETSLSNEYLLNEDGRLEIHKKYLANGKQAIWILCVPGRMAAMRLFPATAARKPVSLPDMQICLVSSVT